MNEKEIAWNWARKEGIIQNQQPHETISFGELALKYYKAVDKNLNPKQYHIQFNNNHERS